MRDVNDNLKGATMNLAVRSEHDQYKLGISKNQWVNERSIGYIVQEIVIFISEKVAAYH